MQHQQNINLKQYIIWSLRLILITALWLGVNQPARADGPEIIVTGHQKINNREGGFVTLLGEEDHFGAPIAVLGDMDGNGVPDVAVGAPYDDDGGFDRGAVWILFMNADGTVNSHQKISDTAGNFSGLLADEDRFGHGIAALGDFDGDDVTDLAVGAHSDSENGHYRGAVWILFLNSDGTVKDYQKINDTHGGFTGTLDNDDAWGTTVSYLGDLDGDTVPDIAVGAPYDDDGGNNRGAVWILFLNSDGTVKGHQKISDTAGNFTGTLINSNVFGYMLAPIGDLDGDEVLDLAVGAMFDDDGGIDRGAVWILFLNDDGTVKDHQKISSTQGGFTGVLDNDDIFGRSIAATDLNGDLVNEVIVGAGRDGDGGFKRGAVWVLFLNSDGTVNDHQKISSTEGGFSGTLQNEGGFGSSVAAISLSGNQPKELMVGVFSDDDGNTDAGAVWVLAMNSDGTVNDQQKISNLEGAFITLLDEEDHFGAPITVLGDMDGNGVPDVAVGAPYDDDGGFDRGAVWILFMNADGTVKSHQKISSISGNFSGLLDDEDRFGHGLAALGDLDGDNVSDIAVGAQTDSDNGHYRGAVWILFLNSDGTVKDYQKINGTQGNFSGTLNDDDQLGTSVTALGDLDGDDVIDIAIGAPYDDDGGNNHGAVWILFLNDDGTVKGHQKISDTAGGFSGTLNASDLFGYSSSLIGDLNGDEIVDLAVGARFDDNGGIDRGAVWILFLNDDGTVKGHQKISSTQGGFTGVLDNDDSFGTAVGAFDVNGDQVNELIIGATRDDDGGLQRGAIWILFLNSDGTVEAHQKISNTQGGFTGTLENEVGFGSAVAVLDLDGDQVEELMIGARGDDEVNTNAGAVWVLFFTDGPPPKPLKLTKTASASQLYPGDTLTYELRLTAPISPVLTTLTDTLPSGLSYVADSLTTGASYSDGHILYSGLVTPGLPLTISYQTTVAAGLEPGQINNIAIASGADDLISATATVAVQPWVTPTLFLKKQALATTALPNQIVTYQLVVTASGSPVLASLTDTLPLDISYVADSVSGGATYQDGHIYFAGMVSEQSPVIITYQGRVNVDVAAGSILYNTAVLTGAGERLERSAAVAVPSNDTVRNLMLIYTSGDNDLSDYMLELTNAAETSAGNPNAIVLLLLDGPGPDDAYLYRLEYDEDPTCPSYGNITCDGRYVEGTNMWKWSGDNVASAYSLAEFLKGSVLAYPNTQQVLVSLVGHGGGWSPDHYLGGQPSGSRKASGDQLGGFGWDEHPGSALSTPALAKALEWSLPTLQSTGKSQYALLYLDACLMAASEVAYQTKDSVEYLLASPSWSWTTFSYDQHIAVLDNSSTPVEIGQQWLQHEADQLAEDDYPFTYSLTDLAHMETLLAAEDSLAGALMSTLPADKAKIDTAFAASDCFDSDQDGMIEHSNGLGWDDNYCDLTSFATNLQFAYSSNNTVIDAAQAVIDAMAAAVVVEVHNNGIPWNYSTQRWAWGDIGGLHKYLPLIEDHWKRAFYTGDHLASAADGQWDEFLATYWNNAEPPDRPACPQEGCDSPPPPLPVAPISLQANVREGHIFIEWQHQLEDVSQYRLYRNGSSIATLAEAQYIDEAVSAQEEYCYQVEALDDDDQSLGESNVRCTHFGITLWIPDQASPSGVNTLLPVNLANPSLIPGDGTENLCIAAMDIYISYNNDIIQANGTVLPTIYTDGYIFSANTGTPGGVKISSFHNHCNPLFGPGTLFMVGFNVIGNGGEVSPLSFITGLTGTVVYDQGDLFTPLELVLEDGSSTINGSGQKGDVNDDGQVNAADAVLALWISTGTFLPNQEQRTACDVNGDGKCTAADVTLILCQAAFQNWGICNSGGVIANSLAASATAQSNIVELSIGQVQGAAGQNVTIPIDLKNGAEFAGGDFTFTYNAEKITPTGLSLTSLTTGFQYDFHIPEPGLLLVSMAANTPIAADGTIFELSLTIDTAPFPLTLAEVYLNNAGGQDFERSVLQKQIVILSEAGSHNIFIPAILK